MSEAINAVPIRVITRIEDSEIPDARKKLTAGAVPSVKKIGRLSRKQLESLVRRWNYYSARFSGVAPGSFHWDFRSDSGQDDWIVPAATMRATFRRLVIAFRWCEEAFETRTPIDRKLVERIGDPLQCAIHELEQQHPQVKHDEARPPRDLVLEMISGFISPRRNPLRLTERCARFVATECAKEAGVMGNWLTEDAVEMRMKRIKRKKKSTRRYKRGGSAT